jgi:hypothetical protein
LAAAVAAVITLDFDADGIIWPRVSPSLSGKFKDWLMSINFHICITAIKKPNCLLMAQMESLE